MNTDVTKSRLAGADGLRAIACLLVVWHHTAQKLNPEGASPIVQALHFLGMRGEVGVSLFFVLSGCLLSMPFWLSFVQKREFPSIRRYAANRAARIAPAFWLNLILCTILAVTVFDLEFSWQRLVSAMFFVNSYNYETFFPAELNGPLWSIGLEVSCYLLLPIVLFFLIKVARSTTQAIAGLGVTILSLQLLNPLFIQLFMTDNEQKGWEFGMVGGAKLWLPYWNIGSFFSQFLIGSLAALVIVHLRAKQMPTKRVYDFLFVISSSLAVALVISRLTPGAPDAFTQQPYVSPFFALLMAAALVFASQSVYVAGFLDNRLFAWLAKLSFGIYLWHVVVIEVIARQFVPGYGYAGLTDVGQWVSLSALVLLVSIAIAAASWKWFEAPILSAVRRAS
jgi:peptidoglycan/LPS O-acetylase OafA/YrhL